VIGIHGWNIDCLKKSGYMRLWCSRKITCEGDWSSMCIYAEPKKVRGVK
jgi:hypothetical protein